MCRGDVESHRAQAQVGARVPGVRPGSATVEHFRSEQNRARFFGGFLLATLSTARAPVRFGSAGLLQISWRCRGATGQGG